MPEGIGGEGYILMHKKGETISLNPAMVEAIRELIKRWPG